jgi:hypothetical protein
MILHKGNPGREVHSTEFFFVFPNSRGEAAKPAREMTEREFWNLAPHTYRGKNMFSYDTFALWFPGIVIGRHGPPTKLMKRFARNVSYNAAENWRPFKATLKKLYANHQDRGGHDTEAITALAALMADIREGITAQKPIIQVGTIAFMSDDLEIC